MIKPTDSWATPVSVYKYFDERYSFALDICASHGNSKHKRYFTAEDDALAHDFDGAEWLKGRYIWCNPPYSKPMPWVELAIKNKALGIGTVMLIKNDCSTRWFELAVKNANKIIFVTGGRIPFIAPAGIKSSSNNFSSCFFVFDHSLNGAADQITEYLNIKEIL